MDWILNGTGCRYSVTFDMIWFSNTGDGFQRLHKTFRLLPWNRSFVFYNNTSADFDTIFWNTGYWFRKLHSTLRLLPWNRSLVSREFISRDLYSKGVGFNNNTSADFDTTPYGVQFTRNKFSWYVFKNTKHRCRKLYNTLRLLLGTIHRYSITTLVQVLIRN